MAKAKSAHFSEVIADHSGDHRSLWKAFNKILHRCPAMHLPDHSSVAALADTFGSFFINKISIIRAAFPLHAHLNTTNLNPPDTRAVLHDFAPVSEAEACRLVLTSPCKSCDLDPSPTTLVGDCIDVLVTPVTSIVNPSLSEGVFPRASKLLMFLICRRNPTLTKENIKNYRPLSNLSFLPKILWQVDCILTSPEQKLWVNFSRHTGNLIQRKLRCRKFMIISYQPWTKARWRRLHCPIYPVRLTPLIIRCFLADWRTGLGLLEGLTIVWGPIWLAEVNRLSLANVFPARSISLLESPRAQFSVLCFLPSILPHLVRWFLNMILYIMFMLMIASHMSFSSRNSAASLGSFKSYLDSVQLWMSDNNLKLNISSSSGTSDREANICFAMFPVDLLGVKTTSPKAARNLCVNFDMNSSFRPHVSAVCRSCHYHIRDLSCIRLYLTFESAKLLAHALVSSRLDYCNSLLFGICCQGDYSASTYSKLPGWCFS